MTQQSYQHDGQVFVGLNRPARAGEWRHNATLGILQEQVACIGGHGSGKTCEALAIVPHAPGVGGLIDLRYKIENGEVAYRWPMLYEWVLTVNYYRGEWQWKPGLWQVEKENLPWETGAEYGPDGGKRFIMERDEPAVPTPLEQVLNEASTQVEELPAWLRQDDAAALAQGLAGRPDYEKLLKEGLELCHKGTGVVLGEVLSYWNKVEAALNPAPAEPAFVEKRRPEAAGTRAASFWKAATEVEKALARIFHQRGAADARKGGA